MRAVASASLLLVPQTAVHAQEMFVVLSDPAIYEYENEPPPSLEWLRERFAKLESRQSPDGQEQWLNWVIHLRSTELIGHVQATVHPNGHAAIAYELSSAYWGRGLARQAVQAMISELVEHHQVRGLYAILNRRNLRSRRLLERLGFRFAPPPEYERHKVSRDELLMQRAIAPCSLSAMARV
jgi:ribosomal-protein-alanine N-acetyltransferase